MHVRDRSESIPVHHLMIETPRRPIESTVPAGGSHGRPPQTHGLRVRIAAGSFTHVGAVRRINEDSLLVRDQLAVIADGMGGHAAGDVASQLAVAAFASLPSDAPLRQADVLAAVDFANDAILASARIHGERAGMGTTICGLVVVSVGGTEHFLVFNVGDSRVYRFDSRQLQALTVDHSEVQELLEAGELTPEEALSYPNRHVVTRSLGSLSAPQPDVWVFPPSPPERFLLCSDGLTTELKDEHIAELLGSEPDVRRAAEVLVRTAVRAGGRDNVSVIVLEPVVDMNIATVDQSTAPRRPSPDVAI